MNAELIYLINLYLVMILPSVRKPVAKKKVEDEEYVLDPKPPPPSLGMEIIQVGNLLWVFRSVF